MHIIPPILISPAPRCPSVHNIPPILLSPAPCCCPPVHQYSFPQHLTLRLCTLFHQYSFPQHLAVRLCTLFLPLIILKHSHKSTPLNLWRSQRRLNHTRMDVEGQHVQPYLDHFTLNPIGLVRNRNVGKKLPLPQRNDPEERTFLLVSHYSKCVQC